MHSISQQCRSDVAGALCPAFGWGHLSRAGWIRAIPGQLQRRSIHAGVLLRDLCPFLPAALIPVLHGSSTLPSTTLKCTQCCKLLSLQLCRAAPLHSICDTSHPQLVGHQGPECPAGRADHVFQGDPSGPALAPWSHRILINKRLAWLEGRDKQEKCRCLLAAKPCFAEGWKARLPSMLSPNAALNASEAVQCSAEHCSDWRTAVLSWRASAETAGRLRMQWTMQGGCLPLFEARIARRSHISTVYACSAQLKRV